MTARAARRWPRLRRLFAAYLNEDWDTLGPKPLDAVARFARDAGPDEAVAAAGEAARLLASARTDRGLDRVLASLRCGHDPAAHGVSPRAFLTSVVRVLRGQAP